MSKKPIKSGRVTIEAAVVEFQIDGSTLWVHNAIGATVLRIKLPDGVKFTAYQGCQNVCSHLDLTIKDVAEAIGGRVHFCLTDDSHTSVNDVPLTQANTGTP